LTISPAAVNGSVSARVATTSDATKPYAAGCCSPAADRVAPTTIAATAIGGSDATAAADAARGPSITSARITRSTPAAAAPASDHNTSGADPDLTGSTPGAAMSRSGTARSSLTADIDIEDLAGTDADAPFYDCTGTAVEAETT
jgi:hypothetical protein